MAVATVVDVLGWIFELTKDKKVGVDAYLEEQRARARQAGKKYTKPHNPPNNNHPVVLYRPVVIMVEGEEVTLPTGTEVIVYLKLVEVEPGVYSPQPGNVAPSTVLATIFVPRNGVTFEQVSVRANGQVARRRVY